MENVILIQITVLEFKEIIREQVTECLSNGCECKESEKDEIGGIDLATEITGLSKSTIYGLVSKRQIPHFKRLKHLYFSRQRLLKWIADGKRKTQSEITGNE